MPTPNPSTLLVVGALHVDEIAVACAALTLGESNPVNWHRSVGGVAANVARTAAASDQLESVQLLAVCGADADAAQLQSVLRSTNVDLLPIASNNASTGRYCAVLDVSGDVLIGLADVSQAEQMLFKQILTHIASNQPAAVVVDGNLAASTLADFAQHPNSIAAPLYAICVSPAKAIRFVATLPTLDVLFCNRSEADAIAQALSERDKTGQAQYENLSPQALLENICAAGCSHIVMTEGSAGVHVCSASGYEHIAVPAFDSPKTLNGPGDALAGATIAQMIGKPLSHAHLVNAIIECGLPAARAILAGQDKAPALVKTAQPINL